MKSEPNWNRYTEQKLAFCKEPGRIRTDAENILNSNPLYTFGKICTGQNPSGGTVIHRITIDYYANVWTEFEKFTEISWAILLCYTTVIKLEVCSENINRRKGYI